MGVVGSGVARVLMQKSRHIAQQAGASVAIQGILVRNLSKPRAFEVPRHLLTSNAEDIIGNPAVDIVVEVMGGEEPALDYIFKSISLGKHVVTANKQVMAKHGPDILTLARKKGVQLLFEASVAGGIPIIGPLGKDLLANDITALRAIINGTTNYILTEMSLNHSDFSIALKEAQAHGYAEADPRNDVEGIDAAYKLAILSTLAFHTRVRASDVHCEGITSLGSKDFRYARELGYNIKLLAIARQEKKGLQVRVHPALVPQQVLLAKVDGVFNAIEIEGDLSGRVVFHGQGAGSLPTTSAVLGDILEIARNIASGISPTSSLLLREDIAIKPITELNTKYYMRLNVADMPGVLAQIARVLGDLKISIASVIQKETDEKVQAAEIVIMTHTSREASMQQAIQQLKSLDIVRNVGSVIRVEEWS